MCLFYGVYCLYLPATNIIQHTYNQMHHRIINRISISICLIASFVWLYLLARTTYGIQRSNQMETWYQQTSPVVQYIPRNMHTVFALLCFVVVIHWLIFPYPSGLLHWHCGNLTIAPVPAKQPWWIWANASCEFIMNDYITTTKQSTTKPCANLLGYTVF